MEALKGFGGVMLGLAVMAGMVTFGIAFFYGVAWVSVKAFDYVEWAAQVAFLISIFVFLPLSPFRVTRMVSAFGLLASSYLFGALTWIFGLAITWTYWGGLAVFIGLMVAGIGVVPMGIVAAAFHSEWTLVVTLLANLALTFATRFLALWLGQKVDRYNYEKRMRIIDAS